MSIAKISIVLGILFIHNMAIAQKKINIKNNYIYGQWRCVKFDCKGQTRYSLNEAKQIRQSTLNIKDHKYYYDNSNFIEECSFTNVKITPYDTSFKINDGISTFYNEADLAKVFNIDLVDKNGKNTCFNNCAILVIKQDTLINFCGGFTFWLLTHIAV